MFAYSVETFSQRKEIREVDTNDRLMKVVNLTMGRSTVLSFQEKPVGEGAWVNGGFFVLNPSPISFEKSWESDLNRLKGLENEIFKLFTPAHAH
jgi:NDP-sugar pyrophosphorylase family protein